MKPGDRVKIKTKDGRKIKGTVVNLKLERDAIGVAGNQYPGPLSAILTVVVEDPRELM